MKRRNILTKEELNMLDSTISDEEAFERFERDCLIRNLRPATIIYYKNELHAVKVAMNEMKLNKQLIDLNETDIEDIILFLKERIKTVSVNTRIRALRTYFNFLYKKKIVRKNPMDNIKNLRDRQKIMDTLSDDEIVRLAKHIKGQKTFVGIRDYTIFMVMIDTGIRLSELTGICVEDVKGNKLFIRKTKNLRERTVFPTIKTQEAINQYLKLRGDLHHNHLFINVNNEPLSSRTIQHRFGKYKEQLKMKKRISPHIFRHTYAKRSILSGMDAFTLAALLGHCDLTITKRYVALWGNDLEEQAKKYSSISRLKF